MQEPPTVRDDRRGRPTGVLSVSLTGEGRSGRYTKTGGVRTDVGFLSVDTQARCSYK